MKKILTVFLLLLLTSCLEQIEGQKTTIVVYNISSLYSNKGMCLFSEYKDSGIAIIDSCSLYDMNDTIQLFHCKKGTECQPK